MKALALVLVVTGACTNASTFEYQATAQWSAASTPTVLAVTIDGQPLAAGETYSFKATFASYADAERLFVAKPVTVEATTGSYAFTLDIGACDEAAATQGHDSPFESETDTFDVLPAWDNDPDEPVHFEAEEGACREQDGEALDYVND